MSEWETEKPEGQESEEEQGGGTGGGSEGA